MEPHLKKFYWALVGPAALGFLFVYGMKNFMPFDFSTIRTFWLTAPLLFILAVSFGVAGPIFFRTLFVYRHRNAVRISQETLIRFERGILCLVLITPYFALIAYIVEIPLFYFAGTVLASFYAVYYFYPSQKRVQYEKKIFRAE